MVSGTCHSIFSAPGIKIRVFQSFVPKYHKMEIPSLNCSRAVDTCWWLLPIDGPFRPSHLLWKSGNINSRHPPKNHPGLQLACRGVYVSGKNRRWGVSWEDYEELKLKDGRFTKTDAERLVRASVQNIHRGVGERFSLDVHTGQSRQDNQRRGSSEAPGTRDSQAEEGTIFAAAREVLNRKGHADVMRSIWEMEEAWVKICQRNFALAEYVDEQNKN